MRIFGSAIRSTLFALLLVSSFTLSTSCVQNPTTVIHPGQVSAADGAIYSALLDVQDAIEAAQGQLATLPALRVPLNSQIIPAYNVAWKAYADYHTALVSGTPPDPSKQQQILAQVIAIGTSLQNTLISAKGTK